MKRNGYRIRSVSTMEQQLEQNSYAFHFQVNDFDGIMHLVALLEKNDSPHPLRVDVTKSLG
jgi:hypothetical protein